MNGCRSAVGRQAWINSRGLMANLAARIHFQPGKIRAYQPGVRLRKVLIWRVGVRPSATVFDTHMRRNIRKALAFTGKSNNALYVRRPRLGQKNCEHQCEQAIAFGGPPIILHRHRRRHFSRHAQGLLKILRCCAGGPRDGVRSRCACRVASGRLAGQPACGTIHSVSGTDNFAGSDRYRARLPFGFLIHAITILFVATLQDKS